MKKIFLLNFIFVVFFFSCVKQGLIPVNDVSSAGTKISSIIEVTASSVQDQNETEYGAWNVADGDYNSRWSSGGTDQEWISFKFQNPILLSSVWIKWESAFSRNYEIQTSNDGRVWNKVFEEFSGDGEEDNCTFSEVKTRYVRIFSKKRSGDDVPWGYSVWEVKINFKGGDTTEMSSKSVINENPVKAALSITGIKDSNIIEITASSTQDDDNAKYNVRYVLDGDYNSRWSSHGSDPQWICLKLKNAMTISGVWIKWEDAFGKNYEIQVSDDARDWKKVYEETAGEGGEDNCVFSKVKTKYVRIYGKQRCRGDVPWGYSIWEVKIITK